jgi:hypothetical protein
MAEERVVETRPPVDGNGAPVGATTERTGEGDVYYTAPRPVAPPPAAAVAPAPILPEHDHIRWASVIAGLITALTVMALLSMLGAAIGFSIFGSGNDTGNIGTAAAIWSGVSALLAFIVGGWVAGRTAGVPNMGSALLNGFLVGATAIVLILWMAAAGIGNLFGMIGSSAGGIIHTAMTSPSALSSAMTNAGSIVNNNSLPADQVQSEARNAAWYVFGATIIGLLAATLGGWLGCLGRWPREVIARK